MMEARAQIVAPADVEISVTASMTLRQWEESLEAIREKRFYAPLAQLMAAVEGAIRNAKTTYCHTVQNPDFEE